jgi:hypothetical protein
MNVIEVLRHLPWEQIGELVDELVEAGLDTSEGRAELATMIDKLLPFEGAAEVLDGPVIRAALEVAWALARMPEGRKRRIVARRTRRAQASPG